MMMIVVLVYLLYSSSMVVGFQVPIISSVNKNNNNIIINNNNNWRRWQNNSKSRCHNNNNNHNNNYYINYKNNPFLLSNHRMVKVKHCSSRLNHNNNVPLMMRDDDDSYGGGEGEVDVVVTEAAANAMFEYKWTEKTLQIGIPALIGMMADPLLSTIDTGFVGRLGAIELASLGACTSIFHLAFNSFRSTTAATTSLVATAISKNEQNGRHLIDTNKNNDNDISNSSSNSSSGKDEARRTINTSLKIGVGIGIVVMNVILFGSRVILKAMGITDTSPLFPFASRYLRIRALAAPAVLVITVAEGAFRGYGDTRIPLLASLMAALINIVLDPLFMFTFQMGVSGAAAATALSQLGAATVYLMFLQKRKMLLTPSKFKSIPHHDDNDYNDNDGNNNKEDSSVGMAIFRANIAMLGKQGSLLLGWAYATARATRIGHDHVAAHQIALSFWLLFAFLLDGAAVSAQVIMSRCFGTFMAANQNKNDNNHDNDNIVIQEEEELMTTSATSILPSVNTRAPMQSLVFYMLKLALVQGLAATGLILCTGGFVSTVFAPQNDPNIQSHLTELIPHLAWQQVLISLTLVAEGLAAGGSKFNILAIGTTISTAAAIIAIKNSTNIVQIWSHGIVTLFVGRFITSSIGLLSIIGLPAYLSKTAWKFKRILQKITNYNYIDSTTKDQ